MLPKNTSCANHVHHKARDQTLKDGTVAVALKNVDTTASFTFANALTTGRDFLALDTSANGFKVQDIYKESRAFVLRKHLKPQNAREHSNYVRVTGTSSPLS